MTEVQAKTEYGGPKLVRYGMMRKVIQIGIGNPGHDTTPNPQGEQRQGA